MVPQCCHSIWIVFHSIRWYCSLLIIFVWQSFVVFVSGMSEQWVAREDEQNVFVTFCIFRSEIWSPPILATCCSCNLWFIDLVVSANIPHRQHNQSESHSFLYTQKIWAIPWSKAISEFCPNVVYSIKCCVLLFCRGDRQQALETAV